ncbi:hypothetical protein IV487_07730 [Enterococcus saccharolyticus]|uniref:hypothetical protein n=2 Tax=Enterococcus TaxID=1350 RepID=UPI001E32DA49|nr:hypothetical protein [Enterococcus saccharolyticus]MCD5002347.1 hypothetical protein [Enterococcus saccharolyticus]
MRKKFVLVVIILLLLPIIFMWIHSIISPYIVPEKLFVLYSIVGTIIFIIGLLMFIGILSKKEIFFSIASKKYLQTTAIIKKEKFTNVSYGGSVGGYGGFRQRKYKLEYRNKDGRITETIYKTGISESKFATVLHWKVGTRIRILYSPKNPQNILIDRSYYKQQVKKIMAMDDW